MREINWNLFKAKFNGKERFSFENLAYHLFCAEHGNRIGIFRFKNQTGLETEPIKVNGENIGFQSKYYETKIRDNIEDIIDSIQKAKRENPFLNKIYFYLNQEFAESTTKQIKDPKYKKEIEDVAKALNVDIEWRVPSHFEIQLSLPDIQYLTDFYFTFEKSIIDFINELKSHSSILLNAIQSDIKFKSSTLQIDRAEIVSNVYTTIHNSQTTILSGEGGIGKSAIIKELFTKINNNSPIYFFKAMEFNIVNINHVFNKHGNFTFSEFLNAHINEKFKLIVIDSAERISDFDDHNTIREFLKSLITHSWRIIFTTRNIYLEDLTYHLANFYRTQYEIVPIEKISLPELINLSKQHSFSLPLDSKLMSLICNPFYFNEYLINYDQTKDAVNINQLKTILWNKKIQNSEINKDGIHLERENCFMDLIKIRASSISFFIYPTECKSKILTLLANDEILGYNNKSGGYFITHDIYEEWGFEKYLNRAYLRTQDIEAFLDDIGTSHVVRRAFRLWLSNKLDSDIEEIKPFLENAIENVISHRFWANEFIVSILKSDYSDAFYLRFKEDILKNDYEILKRIIFVLRTFCKSDDENMALYSNEVIQFTIPSAQGWHTTISFIYNNLAHFNISILNNILPLLSDWVSNNANGQTTKYAGLISLHFYTNFHSTLTFNTGFYNNYYNGHELVKIILQSSSELKLELKNPIDQFLSVNDLARDHQFYNVCLESLSSNSFAINFLRAFPDEFCKIAKHFWFCEPDEYLRGSASGIEEYYKINGNLHRDYFPASAYQTPIYFFLRLNPSKAIDLILEVANRGVSNFVSSSFYDKPEEALINLPSGVMIKQYISTGLWNMYRGAGSPATPSLLQCLHMSLEKYLLENAGENDDSNLIEPKLTYLIENSVSASISAVVTSIILAHPRKYFNVAKILFSCPKFFLFDSLRAHYGESEAKSLYGIGFGFSQYDIHKNERMKTCEAPHRSLSLESLILDFQFYKNANDTEEMASQTQNEIWGILDKLYLSIPEIQHQTDEHKSLRLLLARIDTRKMQPKFESEEEGKITFSLNPEIDEDLRLHSANATKESVNIHKYTSLFLWALSKFDREQKSLDYSKYENEPLIALLETKLLLEELKQKLLPFSIHNSATPAYTCSALIKYYKILLSKDDISFCSDVIFDYSAMPLQPNYSYQISDGLEVSISTLPNLIEIYSDEKNEILLMLTLHLFNFHSIGNYKRICDYSVESIHGFLWKSHHDAAFNILRAFIKFKPLFDNIYANNKSKIYNNSFIGFALDGIYAEFLSQHKEELFNYFNNESFSVEDYDFTILPIDDLDIVLQLIPYDTSHPDLIKIVTKLTPIFCKALLNDNDRIDFLLQKRVFEKLAYFILCRPLEEISVHLEPFISNFKISTGMVRLFQEFINVENKVARYDNFWLVWNAFYDKIVNSNQESDSRYKDIIHTYLLALPYLTISDKNWHTVKEKEKIFYSKIVSEIGHKPYVIDAIAQFLNQIGSEFINDGIFWLSDIIDKAPASQIEDNTPIYMERIIRSYIFQNRRLVKSEIKTKQKVVNILDFLIDRSSTQAYLLREDIL